VQKPVPDKIRVQSVHEKWISIGMLVFCAGVVKLYWNPLRTSAGLLEVAMCFGGTDCFVLEKGNQCLSLDWKCRQMVKLPTVDRRVGHVCRQMGILGRLCVNSTGTE
jgi:hypothetical protein